MPGALRRMALIILTFAILAVGWLGWRLWVAVHAPPPILSLEVNGGEDMRLLPGTPLIFTVTLSGSPGARAARLGTGERPWHTRLRLELAEAERPIPWKPSILGPAVSIGFGHDARGRPTIEEESRAEAVLDADHVHTIDLAVGPEETARVAAGRYTIVASLTQPLWPLWRWRPRVVSSPVVVTLGRAAGAAVSPGELDRRRLSDLADYYLRAKRYEDARKTALEILRADPRSGNGYITLGDALGGLGQNADALESYENALFIEPPPGPEAEPPTYLIERLGEVQDRLSGH
ncbi:MAG: hypothetical protein A2Y95_04080 [Deltaproteobacteria bacterium RBG_13_65_10]|nr:MAG: hypothetical protein A2Y95_04080 [Deltaproteobacteria bacterium RBG_13_65_10]